MIKMDPENLIEELDKGLATGPLILGIFCTKCGAKFELDRDEIVMAILRQISFLDYMRFVKSCKCKACGVE